MKKLRLNIPCLVCKGIIYIGDGTIIEGIPYHFECYKKEALTWQKKKFEGIIEEEADAINDDNGRPIFSPETIKKFKDKLKQKLVNS